MTPPTEGRPASELNATGDVEFAVIQGSQHPDIHFLREIVYVDDQNRLSDTDDMSSTFDRYDDTSVYITGYDSGAPVGTVKVISDSPAGLPCEVQVDIADVRATGAVVAEIGHLLTIPAMRDRRIGMELMRQSLMHAVCELHATHLLADFFVDDHDEGDLRSFYTMIGFRALGTPYRDVRFVGSPMSRVAVLDVPAAARGLADTTGRERELREFFYGGYPDYPDRSTEAGA